MGLFSFAKTLFKEMKEQLSKEEEYINLEKEEVKQLEEDALYEALIARIGYMVEHDDHDEVWYLSDFEKTVYGLYLYEMEINNGGLCQFFVNSSSMFAPFISDALEKVGCFDHKQLFDTFIYTYNIDVEDLSSFKIEDIDEYEAQCERYPFDDFDEAFYELDSIEEYLIPYCKEHIDEY